MPKALKRAPMRVLVVEDSRFFASILRKGIEEKLGFLISLASDRAQARKLLADHPNDFFAALVDLHLPDCSEGEVVDDTVAAGIPTIVFTSSFDDGLRELVLAKNVVDYVTKNNPTSVEQVLSMLRRLAVNGSMKVLVVDDSKTSRRLISRHLQAHNFQTVEAGSGREALALLDSNPDTRLAIIDYNMDGMDGCALITEIRRRHARETMVLIGISAYGNNLLSARFMKAGASDFINKPFIPEELFCRIYQNLELIDHITALTRETAERKLVERGAAELSSINETMISNSALGIAVYRGTGECVVANPALAAMIGGTVKKLRCQNFRKIPSWVETGLLALADQVLSSGRPAHHSCLINTTFGKRFWAEVDVSSFIKDGEPHLLLAFRDETVLKDTEQKFQRERSKLLAVLNSSAIGIVTINHLGIIQSVNPATEAIFGWSVMEMAGKNVNMLAPEPHKSMHDDYITRYRQGTEPKAIGKRREVQGQRKDGSTFPMELTVSVIHDDSGDMTFIGMVTDVSERHAADAAVRRLSSAVENSSAIVVITDREGRIEYANPRICEVSGYSRDELIGQTPAIFKSGETKDETYRSLWRAIRVGEVWRGEFHNRRKDGSLYWVKANIDPIRDEHGTVTHFVAVEEDVTESRKAQKELEAAVEAAEAANRSKSEFLSNMSHELRTPLNAVLGFAQILDFNAKEPLTPSQKKCVDRILTGGHHLLELISEILDLSRIEAGRVELSMADVRLSELLEECRSFVQPLADRQGISIAITAASNLSVRADYTRLKQVLLNLFSNAIKYNNSQGKVYIGCEAVDGDMVEITTSDTGIGIPESLQAELFMPFSRLGQENSSIEGTGIGLTITKRLVEMMGGIIGVNSVFGEGTTFSVTLPSSGTVLPFEQPARGDAAVAVVDDHCGTVVYIEDNPANIELMEMVFSRLEKVRLLTAPDGKLGIELVRNNRPDLILLDLNLPGMDGFEILKFLRHLDEAANTPVFALTASATPADMEKGRRAGFQKYLTKPFVIDDLIEATRDALNLGRME
ncbi:hypothetical protein CU669_11590 [Paramagnetospirillum kuznetsovii]|uniref:Sensor protein FixL n=1 Tax=Paramagnetospirillum kuznetsovii TaxID=2053833 RepID=A0A364NY57_9PROT|nr:PAS domain S-box protein [Paramagnetospirillum kuznetsovii]RAU21930.1 hypothetical protein CU669_11590 [Paramagnetospirillum kuznetsovii]